MYKRQEYDTILSEMQLLPEKMRQFLSHTEDIQYCLLYTSGVDVIGLPVGGPAGMPDAQVPLQVRAAVDQVG